MGRKARFYEDENKNDTLQIRVKTSVKKEFYSMFHEWMAHHPGAMMEDYIIDLIRAMKTEFDGYKRVL